MNEPTGPAPGITVDIIASLFNGAAYLGDFLRSLAAQEHREWRLWVRDDGSSDATVAIVRAAAEQDARIIVRETGGMRLGPAAGFAWLLDRLPDDAQYVMCADQDDVWLPHKISRTLAVMLETEGRAGGPVLVHTDLVVVDERLRVVDPSFWHFADVDPEPVSLRRVLVRNVVTGATVMLNRDLLPLVQEMPPGAILQDWWYACVAAALGRVVAVREATVLYRQHGANAVGARRRRRPRWFEVPTLARAALGRTDALRAEIARTARQAEALLERLGDRLTERDRRLLRAFARLPAYGPCRRKIEVARLRLLREHGLWRNIGMVLSG